MNKIISWLKANWLKLVGYSAGSTLVALTHSFKIGSLLPGFSLAEQNYINSTKSLSLIVDSPLSAPHKLLYLLLHEIGLKNWPLFRLSSVVIGLVSIVLFYAIVRAWQTERIAVFGTALLAGSSWLLHYDRLALPYVATILLVLAMVYVSYMGSTRWRHNGLTMTLYCTFLSLLIYFPGAIILVPVLISWQLPSLLVVIKPIKKLQLAGLAVLVVLLIAPLAMAIGTNLGLIKNWLMWPEVIPSFIAFTRQSLDYILSLFYSSQSEPIVGLGNLPLLDVFSSVMVLLGTYYWQLKMGWRRFLLAVLSLTLLLFAFGFSGNTIMTNAILLPLVYLLIACGITVLLQQWFTVFPRNPLARSVGIAIITFVVGMSAYYHTTRYFIAWPNTPETKQAFKAPK